MTRSLALTWLLVVACSSAPRSPVAPREAPRGGPAMSAVAPRDDEPVWTTEAAPGLAGRVRDVTALSGGEAVVLGAGLHRVTRDAQVRPVCEGLVDATYTLVLADGDRFVALGGAEADARLVRSDDRGRRCERVAVPSLATAYADPGAIAATLHGRSVCVWSSSGAAACSDDLGTTWRRLPRLDGVVEVAPGPDGAVLAASADGERRARLFSLAPGADVWRAEALAGDLRAPVIVGDVSDGAVLVADALGTCALRRGAVPVRRRDPAARYAASAPNIVVPAGVGRFVTSSERVISVVGEDGARPLATLPWGERITALDADADGWWWATDGAGLWRGREGSAREEMVAPPLAGGRVLALAARGGAVLVVGDRGVATWRTSARGRWQNAQLPAMLGRPLAAHLDAEGGAWVVGRAGLAVSDAGDFVGVPGVVTSGDEGVGFQATRDRWIIASGVVSTTSDRGTHWEERLGRAAGAGPHARRPWVLAHAFAGDAVLAIDIDLAIWRSDDAGEHFERVGVLPRPSEARPVFPPVTLAWDGARRVAVLTRGATYVSTDGAATFTSRDLPFVAHWAAWVGTHLVATGTLSHLLPVACREDPLESLLVLSRDGWIADPEACQRRGVTRAQDGDTLWLVDDDLTLHRANLPRFVARAIPQG